MKKYGLFKILLPLITSLALIGCNSFYFHPSDRDFIRPEALGIAYQDTVFTNQDGQQLHGWWIPATNQPAKGSVLYLHGNTHNVSHHLLNALFVTRNGYNLFTFDYRGFGKSEGSPTPQGIVQDSQAALEHLREQLHPSADPIILFGQSLGGHTLLKLAESTEKSDLAAVVTDSAFYSYQEITKDKLAAGFWHLVYNPLAKTAEFLHLAQEEREPAVEAIHPVPVLVIHGQVDEVVPFRHADLIYQRARSPKQLWVVEQCGHIEALTRFASQYRPQLIEYMNQQVERWKDSK